MILENVMFILGLAMMVWHMFIVKRLSSAAFLIDKVMFSFPSVVSCIVRLSFIYVGSQFSFVTCQISVSLAI